MTRIIILSLLALCCLYKLIAGIIHPEEVGFVKDQAGHYIQPETTIIRALGYAIVALWSLGFGLAAALSIKRTKKRPKPFDEFLKPDHDNSKELENQ